MHTAAVLDDGVLDGLTRDSIETVLAPKTRAALNLHAVAPDVETFVLFSSLAGTLGNAGQEPTPLPTPTWTPSPNIAVPRANTPPPSPGAHGDRAGWPSRACERNASAGEVSRPWIPRSP